LLSGIAAKWRKNKEQVSSELFYAPEFIDHLLEPRMSLTPAGLFLSRSNSPSSKTVEALSSLVST
jgi:hypothetical protein